ncbi:MAG: hypothetical protein JWP76_3868 [Dactylosporangium sp.]|jgi:hypothetical protein|nr:hypothetical protein [Dactylosporangium sp.]
MTRWGYWLLVSNRWDRRGPTRTERIDTVARFHGTAGERQISLSVRTADGSPGQDGGGHRPLDTTHLDTVRFPVLRQNPSHGL